MFVGASLMAPDGKYLYLGGSLLSGLSTLVFLGFLNIFFRSQLLFQVRPYWLTSGIGNFDLLSAGTGLPRYRYTVPVPYLLMGPF
jgi:hypothetical protein